MPFPNGMVISNTSNVMYAVIFILFRLDLAGLI
jgi:hypothetical protein